MQAVAGTYDCRAPSATASDRVEMRVDGTITITHPDGQSGSGTWTLEGNTLTTHGVGRNGQEDFTVDGDRILGSAGFVCTRLSS